nr:multiple organellar RNA editing factor 8, chloroplastic/mitochondrial-like [Ipomoea batatas]GME19846.1 multiple organellar RNA editing factor 8, chloroplastic/mitochondrial-like [Ipomoea batatas]
MATLLSRSLITAGKQAISTALFRSYSSLTPPRNFLAFSSFRLRPLVSVSPAVRQLYPAAYTAVRGLATRQTSSSLNDPNPNWSNRPPKETILLDGCDFEHWLVVMEKPEGDPTRDDIIDSYIKTLAQVVGSEEEARMKIYSVSTRHYYAFGALVSEELSYKLKELKGVRWVLPDSYLDVKNKDYGGEPFINGQAVPYDPKYHEEWVRNNARANERNRRNDRPRNFDRSRNFERRQMANQNAQNPGPRPNFQPGPGPNQGNFAPGPNQGNFAPGSNQGNFAPGPNQGNNGPSNYGPGPNQSNSASWPNQNSSAPGPNQNNYAPGQNQNYPPPPGPNQHNYPPPPGPNQQNYPPPGPNQHMSANYAPGPNQNYTPGPNPNYYPPGPNQNNYAPNMDGRNPSQNQNIPPPNYHQ